MCATEKEIREKLKHLPVIPCGLITMREPGEFHGVVEWKVVRGSMISFTLIDHPNCEIHHTHFRKNTEISWHTHGESSDEILICISGELTIIFEDSTHVVLQAKDQCNIKKKIHHMAMTGDNPTEVIAITIPKER